jgi:hypothetical protein
VIFAGLNLVAWMRARNDTAVIRSPHDLTPDMARAAVGAAALVPTTNPTVLRSAVIETVQATADVDLVGDPYDLAQQVARDPNLWRRLGRDQALLHADASGLGSLRLRRASFGDHAGRMQVVAEANLASLTYGKEGKALTLPQGDIGSALQLVVDEAAKALPSVAPRTLTAWRTSRVDASVTWALQPLDGAPLFAFMRDAFFAQHGGRVQVSQPGPRSLMLAKSKEDKVRLYDKSLESSVNGSPLPQHLSQDRATLVRLESQIVARTARKRYGDNLGDLATEGATVASLTLSDWLSTFGDTAKGRGVLEVAQRLVLGGMPADRAMLLAGPALILRTGGVEALIAHGVARRTAYRWRSEISAAVPDDVWREELGIPLRLEDAVFADQFCDRIA